MPVYLLANLRIVPGKMQPMLALLKDGLVPALERQGWKLAGCFTTLSGARNTIVDLWELDDLDHFQRGYQGFIDDPQFASIKAGIDAYVAEEVLTFLDRKLPER